MPLLEEANRDAASPRVPFALANCYVALGELLKASDLYAKVVAMPERPEWNLADRAAIEQAKRRAEQVGERIPELRIKPKRPYEALIVRVDGVKVEDLDKPIRLQPDRTVEVVARARGFDEITERVTLPERARKELVIELIASEQRNVLPPRPPPRVGARGRALVIPKFIMNMFGDGGANVIAPGGAVVATLSAGDADVNLAAGYANYRLGDTVFKPSGAPDTEWEVISSDLQSIYATIGIARAFALNSSRSLKLTLGGSLGVGWTPLGELRRNQIYPRDLSPGDPNSYVKCRGPNDPAGTFRYCNQLDKDADHYGDFAEPSWFSGGLRPTLYPWLALPEVVLEWQLATRLTFDLELALTLGGAMGGVGFRYAL